MTSTVTAVPLGAVTVKQDVVGARLLVGRVAVAVESCGWVLRLWGQALGGEVGMVWSLAVGLWLEGGVCRCWVLCVGLVVVVRRLWRAR